jgi:hypothetical protein
MKTALERKHTRLKQVESKKKSCGVYKHLPTHLMSSSAVAKHRAFPNNFREGNEELKTDIRVMQGLMFIQDKLLHMPLFLHKVGKEDSYNQTLHNARKIEPLSTLEKMKQLEPWIQISSIYIQRCKSLKK